MNYYLKVLKNYATFTGRARRKELWMYFFISFIPLVGVIWFLVLMCMDGTHGENKYGLDPKEGSYID